MITREMVKNGFELKKISIEIAYVGCIGICCRIYDNAFYFLWSAEENGIYETEFNYYKAVLSWNMNFTEEIKWGLEIFM